MKDNGFKDSRLLEAFNHIDPRFIAEVADELKIKPEYTPEHGKKAARRSIKYALALAACLVLMSAVIPVVSHLISNFPAGIPSDTVSESTLSSLAEYAEYVLTDEDLAMMNSAWQERFGEDFAPTVEAAMKRTKYDGHYFGKYGDTVVIWMSSQAAAACIFSLGEYDFSFSTGQTWFFNDSKAYNQYEAAGLGLLNDEQIGALYSYYRDEYLNYDADTSYLAESLDEISDEDFFSLIDSYENSIYKSLYELNGEKYGRVIASSESAEDAVKVCTRHFTDNRYSKHKNTVVDCKVIYESDILYGIYVKWEVRGYYYDENVISFKKDIADITVQNVIYGDEESFRICTNQEEQIRQIVLYLFHNKYFGDTVLNYEMLSSEGEYVITIYSYDMCFGDWGIPDEYRLLKHTVEVDKTNGDVTFREPIVLKTVYRYREANIIN